MNRLAIIVPVPECSALLEETLLSVLENRPTDCEVVVVHCGTYEDPYELGDEVTFVELASGASLLECIEAGVSASESEIIHFLLRGLRVQPHWADTALSHFEDPQCAAVSPLILHPTRPDHVLCSGVSLGFGGSRRLRGTGRRQRLVRKSSARIIGPALEAAFYRRTAFELVGGLSNCVGDRLADIDLALSLQSMGFSAHVATDSTVIGPSVEDVSESSFCRGRHAKMLLLRHKMVTGGVRSLLVPPAALTLHLLIDVLRGRELSELLGRIYGVTGWRQARKHHLRMRQIATADVHHPRTRRKHDATYRFDEVHSGFSEGTSANQERKHSRAG